MKLFTRFLTITSLLLVQTIAWAATVVVEVRNNEYSPQVVNIRPGDVVRFRWIEGTHPTVSDSSPLAFGNFTPSATVLNTDVTFNSLGVFDYHCTSHGVAGVNGLIGLGMAGRVNVTTATPTHEAAKLAAALNVYPNPARGGRVTITSGELRTGQAYQLRVTNIIGREVHSAMVRSETLSAGQALDLSGLPSGLYFCSLLSNDKILATKRITVQN